MSKTLLKQNDDRQMQSDMAVSPECGAVRDVRSRCSHRTVFPAPRSERNPDSSRSVEVLTGVNRRHQVWSGRRKGVVRGLGKQFGSWTRIPGTGRRGVPVTRLPHRAGLSSLTGERGGCNSTSSPGCVANSNGDTARAHRVHPMLLN